MRIANQIVEKSRLYEKVIEACQYILRNDFISASARDYLDKRLDSKVQTKYQFGYFPADEQLSFLFSILDQKILERLGLVYPKCISGGTLPRGHFGQHNLIMPFRNVHGDIISLLGRTLLPSEQQKEQGIQKYKYTFGANKDLYVFGLNDAKASILEKNCVICIEGQFDHISLYTAGIPNSVAFGSANLSQFQFFKLHRYTNNFILLLDNDEAGRKATQKHYHKYSSYANIVCKAPPKGYKDIDEFLCKCEDESRRSSIINGLKEIKFS